MQFPHAQRNALIAAFRRRVYSSYLAAPNQRGVIWFPHQADWQLASEGWTLLPVPYSGAGPYTDVLMPSADLQLGDDPIRSLTVNGVDCAVLRRVIAPRIGGTARIVADLAGFKAGKSFGGALWLSGFAAVPYKVHLVGFEYSTSEPEFEYLCEFLLSERGMKMRYSKFLNDRRQGRMLIELADTGASFEVKTWERKESLKGKKVLCYYYAEAYQLPGLECFTSVAQNLRELQGWACFTTTPDRPWVSVLHDQGHGRDPEWHCTCEVDSRCNPHTFSQRDRDRDDPEKNGIMTRERFAIAWQGKLGHFVGRVYNYGRGQKQFSPLSHPMIWNPQTVEPRGPDAVVS